MGKHEVGTPKYIANKIKAKGLQKLRWYCQMCQKQCRDENGFKCHTMSESHHRQLLLFADNASRYMDQFSREFSDGYLNLLKRQFGTRRVPANRVYQEYISDRGHVHMNATMWLTLTGFVKWLGRTGKCVVDETEKGWYITYIDRDPETLAAQEKKVKKQKMDKDDQEQLMKFIEKQIEKGQQQTSIKEETEETTKEPLIRPDDTTPLVLDIKLKPKPKPVPVINPSTSRQSEISIECSSFTDEIQKIQPFIKLEKKNGSNPNSEKHNKSEGGWLREKLVVKVITKSLGDKYYKAKGIVKSVENSGFVAKVKLTTPEEVEGHLIKLDQEYLETVIPAIGKEILILWGKYKGEKGIVKKLHIEEYTIDVQLEGKLVRTLPYEQNFHKRHLEISMNDSNASPLHVASTGADIKNNKGALMKSRMSLIPKIFSNWWEMLEQPHKLYDQRFGMGMHPEQFFGSFMLDKLEGRRLLPFSASSAFYKYYRPWADLIRDENTSGWSVVKNDKDKFHVTLEVQQFKPEEVNVKIVDNYIVVEGKHEEQQDDHGIISRHFVRKYLVPDQCDPEKATSSLSSDGVLTITAPRKPRTVEEKKERIIKIEHTGKPALENEEKNKAALQQ